MKSIIKLALILVVGILVYNYFLGSPNEKATSEKVFQQVKDVGRSIGDIVKQEKRKFAEGKYDKAFENLGNIYEGLKSKVNNSSLEDEKKALERLEDQKDQLEAEKDALEDELDKADPDEEIIRKGLTLDDELKKLVDETTSLFEKVMNKQKKRQEE